MRRNTLEKTPYRVVRIKELMKEENLNQSQLAEKLHMTQQNLSRILASQKISDVLINEICEIFPEYSSDWLKGEDVKIKQRITGKLRKEQLQNTGFDHLVQYLGYTFTDADDSSKICIQKDQKTALISYRTYNAIQKDLCDYLDYKLSKLF